MTRTIELGISTCPNDTFVFHALMERAVEWRGLEFHVELMDIDALNRGLAAGRFDAAKASFHAALRLSDDVVVLPSGSALGFGVGPVLLAAAGRTHPSQPVDGRPPKVLCPGEWTTATLLFRLFHTGVGHLEQVRFSEIMPALEEGSADFGVCIHEGRFTWRDRGLNLVEDLGTTWEGRTGAPLPLGGIMGRKESGQEDLLTIAEVIRDSIAWARKHPAETLATMRRFAQELDDEVIRAHVDLYVNDWTLDLGDEGRRAIAVLGALAREAGVIGPDQPRLQVIS